MRKVAMPAVCTTVLTYWAQKELNAPLTIRIYVNISHDSYELYDEFRGVKFASIKYSDVLKEEFALCACDKIIQYVSKLKFLDEKWKALAASWAEVAE